MGGEIKITCTGSDVKPIGQLRDFQGNLKSLEEEGWYISDILLSEAGTFYRKKIRVVPIICDHCGCKSWSQYSNFMKSEYHFCDKSCYHKSTIKQQICTNASHAKGRISRLIERNKSVDMREKVSRGLKQRKIILGDNYHSKEAKRQIGTSTKERWSKHKFEILPVLLANSERRKDKTKYGHTFRKLRLQLINKFNGCLFCDNTQRVAAHHIFPVRFGGDTSKLNLVPLCPGCHKRIETLEWKLFNKLTHSGFQETEAWHSVYAYFNHVCRIVMGNCYEQ